MAEYIYKIRREYVVSGDAYEAVYILKIAGQLSLTLSAMDTYSSVYHVRQLSPYHIFYIFRKSFPWYNNY